MKESIKAITCLINNCKKRIEHLPKEHPARTHEELIIRDLEELVKFIDGSDKKVTAQEVPVQEQYVKTNQMRIEASDFEKIVILLGVMLEPIDFNNKFKIVLNYNPNNAKVELDYFKSE